MARARYHLKLIIRVFTFVLGGLALAIGYGLTLWRAPDLLINQDLLRNAELRPEHRLTAEHNARLIVISIGGALVVGIGLLYTARNYRLAHRGQVTERFTKALERLGSTELYVRIGGVHALEHVMRDSPEHHEDVVKVLVAFIRDRVPRAVTKSESHTFQAQNSRSESQWLDRPFAVDTIERPTEPAPDVQAALTALSQRPVRSKHEREILNLAELHLEGAQLELAQLQGANLIGAQLERANLWGAQLERTALSRAQLQHANLGDAQLQHADLWSAQLEHANLSRAQLQHANLIGAQLQHANLGDAQLERADLSGAQLQHANLGDAQLERANLAGAQLQHANLVGAQLERADLSGAQLQHAHLRGANIRPEQLYTAKVDDSTRLAKDT